MTISDICSRKKPEIDVFQNKEHFILCMTETKFFILCIIIIKSSIFCDIPSSFLSFLLCVSQHVWLSGTQNMSGCQVLKTLA